MNDQQLKSLLKAVECGSLSKAEDALFLSKQAIKKQLDSLEEEIGFALLVRTRQGISLTPAGEEFCRGVRKILGEIDSVTHRCKELAFHKQTIRIENPYHPRLLLENAFNEFSRRFPYINRAYTYGGNPLSRGAVPSGQGIPQGRLRPVSAGKCLI